MAGNEDDPRQETPVEEVKAVESVDISIPNSLIGHGSPRSLQLWGKVGTGDVHVTIYMQGLSMEVNLYLLPMKGPDMVLGIQWLQKLRKSDESLHMKRISLHRMQVLLETKYVYGVYELHILSAEEDVHATAHAG
ncbi:hypothetical protein Tco_1264258 [Tanacetum coccineum]